MWAAYDKQSVHIQAAAIKARELLEKEAKGHEMMSVPRPKGENIFGLSTEKLIAAQNEAARIVRNYAHRERVGEVLEAIARGSADKVWSVRWEIDGGLWWDAKRQVWVGEDGFAYLQWSPTLRLLTHRGSIGGRASVSGPM
jgi:hypothetical protein